MKKILLRASQKFCVGFALLLAFSASLPVSAVSDETSDEATQAEEITSGDYTYAVDSETGEGYITAYTGSDTEITLPEKLDDVSITGIAADAFYNCDTLEKITISASITDIGESVFYDCDKLQSFAVAEGNETYYAKDDVLFRTDDNCVMAYPPALPATSYTVPDGSTEIYYAAFGKCTNLEEIILPDSLVYIDDWAFAYDTISEISIPDGVVEICDYAFVSCENITDWTLPESLTYIGGAAFANCSGMTEIALPSGLTTVGQAAFVGTGLTEITIPSSVTSIGYCAFGYEADMTTTVENFIIYGESGSMAETYASDSDEEYSYSNSFTFVTVQDASIVRGGRDAGELSTDSDSSSTTDDDSNVVITEEKKTSFNSKYLLLGISGGVLLVGAILVILGLRTGKKPENKSKDATKDAASADDKNDETTDTESTTEESSK